MKRAGLLGRKGSGKWKRQNGTIDETDQLRERARIPESAGKVGEAERRNEKI